MAFPNIGDFNDRNFDEDIYPPYRNIVRNIRNLREYSFIRNKLEELKMYIKKVYGELDKLEQLSDISYADFMTTVYNSLGRIETLAGGMDNLIGDIASEINNDDTFKWYLKRVQIEVVEDILMHNANTIRHYMKQGLDLGGLSAELYPFIREAKRALKEVESSIDLALSRM